MKYGWEALEPGNEFVSNWSVDAITEHLSRVSMGHTRRLLINVPPGCTKSMTTSVFWPSWEWGPQDNPYYRYIGTSYAKDLAIRDNVRARDLLTSEWYHSQWPVYVQDNPDVEERARKVSGWEPIEFKADANGKMYYENTKTGWRMAGSSGSQLTGFRGDRIIVDDPHSVKSAESEVERESTLFWFSETLPTRLNKLNESAIVVIMQRLHERDVSGLILANELGYDHLMLPMEFEPERRCWSFRPLEYVARENERRAESNLPVTPHDVPEPVYWSEEEHNYQSVHLWNPEKHDGKEEPDEENKLCEMYPADPRQEDEELLMPERFSRESVDELKAAFRSQGGSYAEAGQLQQRPAPRGGGMFAKDDWIILDHMPKDWKVVRWVRGWDLAGSTRKRSPFTAGVLMGITADKNIVISDVNKGQWKASLVREKIKATTERDGHGVYVDIPQDPGQAGLAQKADLAKLLHGYNVVFSPETGSKEDRAEPLAAQQQVGNVYLIRGEWNMPFINESASFPNGEFKDQIDGASRAYANLVRKPEKKPLVGGRLIGG